MLKIFFIPFLAYKFPISLIYFLVCFTFFGGGGSGIGYADRPKMISFKLKSFLDYGL